MWFGEFYSRLPERNPDWFDILVNNGCLWDSDLGRGSVAQSLLPSRCNLLPWRIVRISSTIHDGLYDLCEAEILVLWIRREKGRWSFCHFCRSNISEWQNLLVMWLERILLYLWSGRKDNIQDCPTAFVFPHCLRQVIRNQGAFFKKALFFAWTFAKL